jgi:hypothetical protein
MNPTEFPDQALVTSDLAFHSFSADDVREREPQSRFRGTLFFDN